ncbi:MAG: AAA family ATPase [Taibaiella sp.]|nr:AAA family ATPase [Taibaiella sp.]
MKLIVKNYKCFDEDGVELGPFKDVNVIIGKNNSGKSSIIDVVKYLMDKNAEFLSSMHKGNSPEINSFFEITKEAIDSYIDNSNLLEAQGQVYYYHLKQLIGNSVQCNEMGAHRSLLKSTIKELEEHAYEILKMFVQSHKSMFFGKKFIHISAERDVQPEASKDDLSVFKNGDGVTNFIQKIINDRDYDSSIVETLLLEELNKITNPDMVFNRILVQVNKEELWEIFLEDELNIRVPLSKMGSGIKTILLVIILVKIQPYIVKGHYKDFVFCLEELENNLHPSQQRRLYKYLYEFSKTNGAKFFITTHSNIVIDLYSRYENAQIMHVYKESGTSKVKTISDPKSITTILDDLAVKASDILQSNAVIWVEGPSDRTYIKHWIGLVDPDLIEGYHYSIMFYGGRLLSNLSLDYDNLENDLISLIRLNRNSFVVMDRDGSSAEKGINATKQRIVEELGDSRVWVTHGREIENYLSDDTLTKWLKTGYNLQEALVLEDDQKVEDAIQSKMEKAGPKYAMGKAKFAKEIIEHITLDNFGKHDLRPKIDLIINMIRECNK